MLQPSRALIRLCENEIRASSIVRRAEASEVDLSWSGIEYDINRDGVDDGTLAYVEFEHPLDVYHAWLEENAKYQDYQNLMLAVYKLNLQGSTRTNLNVAHSL